MGFGELVEAAHHRLHVERAGIGAEGITEVDDAPLTLELRPGNFLAVLVHQRERPADRSAGQRRFLGGRYLLLAGREREA